MDAEKIKELTVLAEGLGIKFDTVNEDLVKAIQEVEKNSKIAEANASAVRDLEKANERNGARITELKDFLLINNGKSGLKEFENLFGKWVKGCYEMTKFGRVSESNQIDGYSYDRTMMDSKALEIGTDAAAGYLVPEILAPMLYAAKDIYGTITPLMDKMTLPGGQTALINRENAKPVAKFRVAGENENIDTTDPTYAQDNVVPMLVGSLITVSNELLGAQGVNYTSIVAPQMLRAIVLAEEDAFLKGAATVDSPTNGILVDGSVEVGAAVIGGDTLQDWLAFIAEACATIEHLYRTTETVILTTPAKVYTLAADSVGTNVGNALSWADPVNGVPGRIIGYPFLGHPAMFTTKAWAAMFNPKHFLIANSGQMAVDVNPLGSGFKTNSSDIRVFTHTDFTLNDPTWYFKNSWA